MKDLFRHTRTTKFKYCSLAGLLIGATVLSGINKIMAINALYEKWVERGHKILISNIMIECIKFNCKPNLA